MRHDSFHAPLIAALTRHYDELVDYVRRRFGDKNFAQEVVNDVCLQLLESPQKENQGTPLALLRHISMCKAIDRYRSETVRNSWLESTPVTPDTQTHVQDGESIACGGQLADVLQRTVDHLPPRCREVFMLHKIEDLPQHEVAKKLGISRKMVAKHLARAMSAFAPEIVAHLTPRIPQPGLKTRRPPRPYGITKERRLPVLAVLLGLALAGTWIIDPAYRTEQIATSTGQISTWHMTDGSEIRLNTDSSVTVEWHLRSRRLFLHHGEATFDVAHTYRNFVVRAGAATVTDVGTIFNVRRQDGGAQVTVLQGSVLVASANQPGTPILLTTNQQTAATEGGVETVRNVHADEIAAWRHRKLIFNGTPLRQVIVEIQRYRQASISLRDARLGNLRLSGEYDISGLENLIDALPATLPVSIHRDSSGNVTIAAK